MSAYKNHSFASRLSYALQGLSHGLRSEVSLRTQAIMFVAALIALAVLRPGAIWWAMVLLASAAVLAAELFNTAIEHLADELHPADSPGMRIVKDCAAAGVLIASLGAVGVAVALVLHLLSPA
ncbi:MAG TPA: diacylglycerol kinase [Steroidobacteraceae bacterium]|nr:diacylglycerol kinase [Steroidobacteraceae bacterium]